MDGEYNSFRGTTDSMFMSIELVLLLWKTFSHILIRTGAISSNEIMDSTVSLDCRIRKPIAISILFIIIYTLIILP